MIHLRQSKNRLSRKIPRPAKEVKARTKKVGQNKRRILQRVRKRRSRKLRLNRFCLMKCLWTLSSKERCIWKCSLMGLRIRFLEVLRMLSKGVMEHLPEQLMIGLWVHSRIWTTPRPVRLIFLKLLPLQSGTWREVPSNLANLTAQVQIIWSRVNAKIWIKTIITLKPCWERPTSISLKPRISTPAWPTNQWKLWNTCNSNSRKTSNHATNNNQTPILSKRRILTLMPSTCKMTRSSNSIEL